MLGEDAQASVLQELARSPTPTSTKKTKTFFFLILDAVLPVPGPQLCSCIRRDTSGTLSCGPRQEYQMAWLLLRPLLYVSGTISW